MNAKGSPLPWRVNATEFYDAILIEDADGREVARIRYSEEETGDADTPEGVGVFAAEDAERIAESVNALPALIEAAREVLDHLDKVHYSAPGHKRLRQAIADATRVLEVP